MTPAPRPLLLAACLVAGASFAEETTYPVETRPPPGNAVYKCGGNTYTNVPCDGAVPLGSKRVSRTFEVPPPQDRARQMARAQLAPQEQQRCATLESWIRGEEARLKGRKATEAEEGELAIRRVHYREMRC